MGGVKKRVTERLLFGMSAEVGKQGPSFTAARGSILALGSDGDPQVAQLRVADWGGGVDHQIDRAGGFGEGNDFAQAFGSGDDHDDAVEAEGDAAVRRRAVFEGFEEKSEAGLGLFFVHAEGAENFALNILAVNTDGTGAEFGAVQYDVIGKGADCAQRGLRVVQGLDAGFEQLHIALHAEK